VGGLLGSTGLGTQGIGLADLTPIGAALSTQEDVKAGHYKEAAVNIVPGAGPLKRGAKEVANDAARIVESLARPALLESRSVSMHNPPATSPRPFAADYPAGAQADATGRLTHDIEGRPLTAERVVGRRVVGGNDEALSPAEYVALTEALTGRRPEVATLRGAFGHYRKRPLSKDEWDELKPWQRAETTGFVSGIDLSRRLTAQNSQPVHAHEIGHAINDIAGSDRFKVKTKSGIQVPFNDIPVSKEMETEIRTVYGDLNGGKLPQDYGYSGRDIRSELMAEAVRAYMADPNYIKSVAPRAAAQIRQYVNGNPKLNRAIQFNTPAAVAAGGATLGAILSSAMQQRDESY
jgi:hypothetical protein